VEQTRPALQTYRGAHYHFTLPHPLYQQIVHLSQQEGVTLCVTLLAAFNVLLARYAGQEDIVVGTPVANRTHSALENLIGFFVNTLALRNDLSGNPSFREFLLRVQRTALDAYMHQEMPFEMVVEALQPERSANQTPLFQVFFALQNAALPSLEMPGLKATPLDVESGTVKFDLTLALLQTEEGLSGEFGYNLDLFSQKTIEQMTERYLVLLQAVATDPACRIQDICLLTPAEQRRFQASSEPVVSTPILSVAERFVTQVRQWPKNVAVVDGQHPRDAQRDDSHEISGSTGCFTHTAPLLLASWA
jgi:non-ribosomal peptide synthetase component F